MKEKQVGRYEGTLKGVFLKTPFGVILTNWFFQGMRYMNGYERFVKLMLDAFVIVSLLAVFGRAPSPASVILLFLFAHTLNWMFNGHIFVLMRYVRPFPKTPDEFDRFVRKLQEWGRASTCVQGIAIYGSYCRGQLHGNSDLDVRVLVDRGAMPGLCGAIFCVVARWKAFFAAFPLDVYCSVGGDGLDRLRDDEHPSLILDKTGMLAKRYGNV
jgi:hypothetical protein